MIRRMEKNDVAQVAEIEKACFFHPWSEASLMEYTDRRDAAFCVCEIEGKIVGYAGMYYVFPEGDITNVAILEAYRGKGYATAVLEEMFRIAKSDGIKEYTLEVRTSNHTAIGLYEKFGFKGEGVRKNFYDHPKEDALIMWKRTDDSHT